VFEPIEYAPWGEHRSKLYSCGGCGEAIYRTAVDNTTVVLPASRMDREPNSMGHVYCESKHELQHFVLPDDGHVRCMQMPGGAEYAGK
jgi:hypothetical protein